MIFKSASWLAKKLKFASTPYSPLKHTFSFFCVPFSFFWTYFTSKDTWNFSKLGFLIQRNTLNIFSYVACPDASRTPGLSRTQEGLLVAEIDLNQIRQIRDYWTLRMTARLDMYRDVLTNVCSDNFKPKIIKP